MIVILRAQKTDEQISSGKLARHHRRAFTLVTTVRPPLARWLFLALPVLLAATVSCGDGKVAASVHWQGTAGNALLTDQAGFDNTPPAQLWVGFDSLPDFQIVVNQPPGLIVSGVITADPTQPLGFFLDPATTSTTKAIIPEQVLPMRYVSENLQTWTGKTVGFLVKVEQVN